MNSPTRRRPCLFGWAIAIFVLCAAGCGGDGSSGSGNDVDAGGGGNRVAPTVPVTQTRPGSAYTQSIVVDETGDTIVFTVFEPSQLVAGQAYPLILHGHGYGGSRNLPDNPSDLQQRLRDAGYYVISFDQRGFGDSSGTVRIQSPDFEGYDLIALLDWAENLPGLARRENGKMLVGSYGGSYGGMYQLLLAAIDPEQRLRVIAPDISPYDLVYSLYPGGVIKSGWGLALVGAGELPILGLATGGDPAAFVQDLLTRAQRLNPPLRQDPVVFETLIEGALTNQFPLAGLRMFHYHSFSHFCAARTAQPQDFAIATGDPVLDSPFRTGQPPPRIDALITQGFRDTLFNFNNALNNYRCLKQAGGDVRLLTHQGGHILPISLETTNLGLEQALDAFYAAINVPEFQGPAGANQCGPIVLEDATFAWFQAKLMDNPAALQGALQGIGHEICLSLADNDAVTVDHVSTGGQVFSLEMDTPALNGLFGILGSVLGTVPSTELLADQLVYTAPAGGRVLAGIPTLSIDISPAVGEAMDCVLPILPLGCDPIFLIGLGRKPPGQTRWELVDDQLTPVRGFGQHDVNMVGVAERLYGGDQVAVLVYGFHPQYLVTWSRDLLVPAAIISGQVALPLLDASDIVRDL